MKTRLIFSLSVALIFLGMNVQTIAQEKPLTSAKNSRKTQEKQLTQPTNAKQLKTAKDHAATNKKITEKTSKIRDRKISKNEAPKKLNKKETVHHKRLEKKTQKKESNTPQKK